MVIENDLKDEVAWWSE